MLKSFDKIVKDWKSEMEQKPLYFTCRCVVTHDQFKKGNKYFCEDSVQDGKPCMRVFLENGHPLKDRRFIVFTVKEFERYFTL